MNNPLNIEKGKKYVAVCEKVCDAIGPGVHRTVQGACLLDGSVFCVAFVKKDEKGIETVRLSKMDMKGNLIQVSDPLPLDHANNITYNRKKGLLLISHCQRVDDRDCFRRYSFVDPDTFEIKETADLPYPFFSMAYSPEKDMYGSGEWGGQTLDFWDGDLKNVLHIDVPQPDTLSQGCFADGSFVYFVRSTTAKAKSELLVYDWEGNLFSQIPLAIAEGHSVEPENINLTEDGRAFILSNSPCLCYEMKLKEIK